MLKTAGEEQQFTFKETPMRLLDDLSAETSPERSGAIYTK